MTEEHEVHVLRMREASAVIKRLLRKARRDGWDDALHAARKDGHIDDDTLHALLDQNPHKDN